MTERQVEGAEGQPVLSIVIPAYNERQTIGTVIAQVAAVLPDIAKEIIIVDDASTDGTRDWLRRQIDGREGPWRGINLDREGGLRLETDGAQAPTRLIAEYQTRNQGKGAAVRRGFARSTGDIIVIQDADLEYDPADWTAMIDLIHRRGVADVVYGSRFYGRPHRSLYFHHFAANRLISLLFNILYNQTLTDVEVCYKMFTREVLNSLTLTADDFGIEIELSARIARQRRWRIYEMGIHYFGRTYQEGKKINWRDGVKALWYLVKYRVSP